MNSGEAAIKKALGANQDDDAEDKQPDEEKEITLVQLRDIDEKTKQLPVISEENEEKVVIEI